MSDELELTIEAVERDKFYDRTIVDILQNPPVSSATSSDYKITSTNVTIGMNAAFYIICSEQSPDSWLSAVRLILEHGFSIMLHKNKESIANMHKLRYEALKSPKNSNNPLIGFLVMDYENSLIIPSKKSKKANLKIQPRYHNALSKMSAELGFKSGDIITMCLWYSLLTCDSFPDYIKKEGEMMVANFEEQVSKMHSMHSKWFNVFITNSFEEESATVPPTDQIPPVA